MRKINLMALIGVICFNTLIMLTFAISLYALLFATWVTTISFIASPLLVLGATLLNLQLWHFFQMGLAVALAFLAILFLPLLVRISSLILQLSKQYLVFNRQLIYY